jgi:hypothetical protein
MQGPQCENEWLNEVANEGYMFRYRYAYEEVAIQDVMVTKYLQIYLHNGIHM